MDFVSIPQLGTAAGEAVSPRLSHWRRIGGAFDASSRRIGGVFGA
jgi:hypothetical protein